MLKIAVGHDIPDIDMVPLSDYIEVDVFTTPVPTGSVTTRTLGGKAFVDGIRQLRFTVGGLDYTTLSALVTALWGAWGAVESLAVTLEAIQVDGVYGRFNAFLDPFTHGVNYEMVNPRQVKNVEFIFTIVEDIV